MDFTAGGQLAVTRDCVVTGSVIRGDVDPEQADFIHAVMNGRKDMIVGAGEDNGEPDAFSTFSMTEM